MHSAPKAFSWLRFLDSDYFAQGAQAVRQLPRRMEADRLIPFLFLHVVCLGVFWVGASWIAVAVAGVLLLLRTFALTAFYHRYFSHRSFKTSRLFQFIFAAIGTAAVQRGPLWWAAHHRHHHRNSDTEDDVHSPTPRGFIWAHIGWITSTRNMPTDYSVIPDFVKFPELVLLNRFDWLVPVTSWAIIYAGGEYCRLHYPQLSTSGPQLAIWSVLSTVLLFHITCSINSIAHMFGSQRYATGDTSRNNALLALFSMGEGWHNNHHAYPGACRQGFYWWEIDVTYYVLKALSWVGLVWDLHPVPREAYRPQNQRPLPELATTADSSR